MRKVGILDARPEKIKPGKNIIDRHVKKARMLSKNLRVVGCGGVLLIKTQLDGRQQNQVVKWHIAYGQCLKERTDSAHSLLFVARWCSRADSRSQADFSKWKAVT